MPSGPSRAFCSAAAAFSEVRLATHRQSGRQYACKIIPLPDYGQALNQHQASRSTIMKV
jgi:hypothetical protein